MKRTKSSECTALSIGKSCKIEWVKSLAEECTLHMHFILSYFTSNQSESVVKSSRPLLLLINLFFFLRKTTIIEWLSWSESVVNTDKYSCSISYFWFRVCCQSTLAISFKCRSTFTSRILASLGQWKHQTSNRTAFTVISQTCSRDLRLIHAEVPVSPLLVTSFLS